MEIKKYINRWEFYQEFIKYVARIYKYKLTKKYIDKKEYNSKIIHEYDKAQEIIKRYLMSTNPAMIGRLGSGELLTVNQYLRRIFGISKDYSKSVYYNMENKGAFFPCDVKSIDKFANMYLESLLYADVMCAWNFQDIEEFIFGKLASDAEFITLGGIEPFFSNNPWTNALKGIKVLVIHPFRETILKQYERRKYLHNNPDILPEFADFSVIKAVYSFGNNSEFNTWFDALESMKQEADSINFDVAIIGAGPYGFPLAAYIKKLGKKVILMGGTTQLLFGITGARWDNMPIYSNIINKHFVHPMEIERPTNYKSIEKGCYW